MYFDWTYVVFVLPMVILSLIAQVKVKSTYSKYSRILSRRGLTAEQAARMILDRNGLRNVPVGRISGDLTDHFDPRTNSISLSDSVYGNTSVAAIGVAAHESGHAVQYAEGYAPLKFRNAIVPVTQFGAKLSTPLVILGLILSIYPLAYAGIILFGAVVVFQLVTLPTEFNASRRALAVLEEGNYLDGEELRGAKKVLSAAAMTYVAALFMSLMSLLRLIVIVSGSKNSRNRR